MIWVFRFWNFSVNEFDFVESCSLNLKINRCFSDETWIYWEFYDENLPESIWRDFQRWRQNLGILVIADVPCQDGDDLTRVMQDMEPGMPPPIFHSS